MHYCVYLFTKEKPAYEDVERILDPSYEREWDWFQIGGRWTGILDNYDPAQDAANMRPCEYCEATGTTTEAVGNRYPAYKPHVGKPCFQCRGTGQRLVWASHFKPHVGDSQEVANVPNLETNPPYAFIREDMDGEWIIKEHWVSRPAGKGFFQENPLYKAGFNEAITAYVDGWVTVVDCHN